MCLHFYLVLFEQVGYSMFLVQYRKVFSDQYNFFERVDLAFRKGRSSFKAQVLNNLTGLKPKMKWNININ